MADARPYGAGPYSRTLRAVIVTQSDPFYIPWFFSEFGRIYRAGGDSILEVVGVMIQPPLGSRSAGELARRIWTLYGTVGFLRTGVRYLSARIRSYRPRRWQHSVRWYCEAAGIPLVELPAEHSVAADGAPLTDRPARPNNVNGATFHALIEDEAIDLVISVSASQIFGRRTLAAPTIGCINLHNAPLPHFRGMLPNFWQLYHGRSESVLTIHTMVPELDRGEILARASLPIGAGTTLEWLMAESKRRSATVLWDLLRDIHAGRATARPPPEEEGSYFTWPTRHEAREFRRRGYRVW